MKIQFKKTIPHAFEPTQAFLGDAGWDLQAVEYYKDYDNKFIEYDIGVAVEIPTGFVGLVFPRSSISTHSHSLCNSVGVIDSGYRGSIKLRFRYDEDNEDREYVFGDKIAQLIIIPIPTIEFEEVKELSKSNRAANSFGSSDNLT